MAHGRSSELDDPWQQAEAPAFKFKYPKLERLAVFYKRFCGIELHLDERSQDHWDKELKLVKRRLGYDMPTFYKAIRWALENNVLNLNDKLLYGQLGVLREAIYTVGYNQESPDTSNFDDEYQAYQS